MSTADKPRPVEGIVGPKLGDRVEATMNGEEWVSGVFVEEVELFAQYGVKLDETGEVRYFIGVRPNALLERRAENEAKDKP